MTEPAVTTSTNQNPPPADAFDERWYLAMRLDERLALDTPVTETDEPLGADRIEQWRMAAGDQFGRMLAGRLETAGTSLPQLLQLLGEPAHALRARVAASGTGAAPEWLVATVAAFEPLPPAELAHLRSVMPTTFGKATDGALLALVEPVVARGLQRITAHARACSRATAGAIDALAPDLLTLIGERLIRLLERTIAVELQSASMLGLLDGDTPEQRYAHFLARLTQPEPRRELLLQYPVLARTVHLYVEQWVRGACELLTRLDADRDELEQAFGELGAVTALGGSGSDPHQGGRHVWFIDFERGTRIVYKPRPFRAEARFQAFVAQLNDWGLQPQLRTLTVVDRGTHGYIEFVEYAECTSPEEVADFHRRLGAWLGVLHVIGASDLHNENIVAAGAHPVPVDHETILRSQAQTWRTSDSADEELVRMLGETILGTDILPRPEFDAGVGTNVDHSGMGGAFDAFDAVPVERMVGAGTDEMRLGVDEDEPTRYHNRARLNGVPAHARDYITELDAGMQHAFALIASRRDDVIAELEQFAGATVRMVLRPTRLYGRVLTDLAHPWNLGDALDSVPIEASLWSDLPLQPWRAPLLGPECAQVAVGDVPVFSTRIGTHELRAGDGTVVSGAVDRDGLDTARARASVAGTADDLHRHRWVLVTSLADPSASPAPHHTPLDGDTPLALAESVADRLAQTAFYSDDRTRASWLDAQQTGDSRYGTFAYRARAVDSDLYDGLSGIALFLAELAAVTDAPRHRALADAAIRTLVERDPNQYGTPLIGGYAGWGGRIAALTRIGAVLGRDDLIDLAESQIVHVDALLARDESLDVIGGAAGAILSLIKLAEARPGSAALTVAERCANHLDQHGDGGNALVFHRGLSHGRAGAVLAFARLHVAMAGAGADTGRWRSCALAWAATERELIASGGWADDDGTARASMCAWCHGAAGIAIGRLEAWRLLGDDDLHADALQALERTIAAPAMSSHCLCHGRLGNLETLAMARDVLDGDASWTRAWEDALADDVADLRERGAVFPTIGNFATPGLMTGLAGIGHAMLRAAAPDVPSVLVP